MAGLNVPGVTASEVFLAPTPELRTGVPTFLALGAVKSSSPADKSVTLTRPEQLAARFAAHEDSFIAPVVRGFFANGGRLCHVVAMSNNEAANADSLRSAIQSTEFLDSTDLICVPDLLVSQGEALDSTALQTIAMALQQVVLEECDRVGGLFAILDATPSVETDKVKTPPASNVGAIYYPSLIVADPDLPATDSTSVATRLIPACGHIAGTYAASDEATGVFKTAANIRLADVLDLEFNLDDARQATLNPTINCLRSFPGRGIRAWGARTLSDSTQWSYINVRRVILTVSRWIDWNLANLAFEPHDSTLWTRVTRTLEMYLDDLFRQGALKGTVPKEAFFVKCDGENNPPDIREQGMLIAEIGLAPAIPNEFIVVRVSRTSDGVSLEVNNN